MLHLTLQLGQRSALSALKVTNARLIEESLRFALLLQPTAMLGIPWRAMATVRSARSITPALHPQRHRFLAIFQQRALVEW